MAHIVLHLAGLVELAQWHFHELSQVTARLQLIVRFDLIL